MICVQLCLDNNIKLQQILHNCRLIANVFKIISNNKVCFSCKLTNIVNVFKIISNNKVCFSWNTLFRLPYKHCTLLAI